MFFLIPRVTLVLLVVFALAAVFRHWRHPGRRPPLWLRVVRPRPRRPGRKRP